jgi:DNA repair exonuclease SbcCD ATPase subunit
MGSPTIRLRRLGLRSFRSYVDKQELMLPETGLHLIDAPSGHGKSGLVEGIAFAFDYSQSPATEHQSWPWLTEEPMEVDLDFLVGANDASIRRGKKPALKVGDQKPMTAASAISKRLPEVLGIKPEMLQALTYRPQRQRGLLLSMGDTEKKVFLTELLHLGQTEEEVERTQKNIGKLEKDLDVLRALAAQAAQVVPPEPAAPELEYLQALLDAAADAARAAEDAGKRLDEVTERGVALRQQREQAAAQARLQFDGALSNAQMAIGAARRQTYEVDPAAAEKLTKLKSRLKFIQDGVAKLRSDHQAKLLLLRADLDAKRQDLWRRERRAEELPKLRKQHETLVAEIKVLEAQQCPTCEQSWQTPAAVTVLEKKMHEADAVEESIKSAETYVAGLDDDRAWVTKLEAEAQAAATQDPVPQKFYDGERAQQAALGALQQEQLGAKQQFDAERAAGVAKLQADYQALVLQRDQAVVAAGAVTDEQRLAEQEAGKLFQESHGAEKAKLEADAKLQAARARNEAEQRRYDGDLARYLAAKRGADDAAGRAAASESTMRAEEDFWSLLKSFLALVFDETLQCVAARANELLVGVPNVGGITLDFASERETKSGTVRQEIKLLVRKDGHEIPFRGCSGGQQAVIELAVDLALAEVIAERTGVYPGWLVLDEPFDGLGAVDKEACMDVLSRVAEDRAIFVIDHSAEVKSTFDSVIAVKYVDGRSTLSFAA